MRIPKEVNIGDVKYSIQEKYIIKDETKHWLLHLLSNRTLLGQINYMTQKIQVRKIQPKKQKEVVFFHELAHGMLNDLEFNHPKIIRFRNDEEFIGEFALVLRKTFLDLMEKQNKKDD